MPEACTEIIDKIIETRHIKGMTQKELAEATKLTQSVIARFEAKKTTPQLDTLLKITSALGLSLALVSGEPVN